MRMETNYSISAVPLNRPPAIYGVKKNQKPAFFRKTILHLSFAIVLLPKMTPIYGHQLLCIGDGSATKLRGHDSEFCGSDLLLRCKRKRAAAAIPNKALTISMVGFEELS